MVMVFIRRGAALQRAALLLVVYALLASPLWAAEPVQVVVTGVEGKALENVAAILALPAGLVRDGSVNQRWLKRFERQIPEKVRKALAPFGYYRAQASTTLDEFEPGRFRLQVAIDPGRPVRVEHLRVDIEGDGSNNKDLRKLVGAFPLHRGGVLRQDLYEEAKGGLKARALDLGYLDADFKTHVIRIDLAAHRAEIDLVLATGPRYRFGEVLLHGAPYYPERFLHRYQSFREGDIFSHGQLGQTQLNFLDSDRFKEVLVTPRQDLALDLKVPVDVQLVPSARRRLRPGIGFGTDTGARLSLRYKDVNIFHLGHELSIDTVLAQVRQSLVASYTLPGYRNIESQTVFRVGLEREDVDTFETQSIFAEAERIRGFGKGRVGSVFVRLLQEDFTIAGERDQARMILPGVRYGRRRYKDPIRPKQGYSFNLEVRGGHQYLGSDTGLLQLLASGNALAALPARLTLFARVQGAASVQNEPLRAIPASLRFFAGGDQSVRGYAYQALGPKDADGEVIGGKNLAVGSLELERAVADNWGIAAFYDVGNAFNAFSGLELKQGAGLGLRYYTQVGPLKVDVARQIGEDDNSFRLHLSVGFGW